MTGPEFKSRALAGSVISPTVLWDECTVTGWNHLENSETIDASTTPRGAELIALGGGLGMVSFQISQIETHHNR